VNRAASAAWKAAIRRKYSIRPPSTTATNVPLLHSHRHAHATMPPLPSEQDKPNENPYESPSVDDPRGTTPTGIPKVRTVATSIGLIVAIVASSAVAFYATCSVGAFAGVHVSKAVGAVSEGVLGYGFWTGVTVGSVSALAVAILLSRKLFRRVP